MKELEPVDCFVNRTYRDEIGLRISDEGVAIVISRELGEMYTAARGEPLAQADGSSEDLSV